MRTLLQDSRYALRMFRANPGLTATAVVALALGIGANTAIFSVVNSVLLRPLPYPESERLVDLYETEPELARVPVNMQDFLDWRKQDRLFEQMALFGYTDLNLTADGRAERVRGWKISANYLRTLGIAPVLGRDFRAEDNARGRNRVAILTHGVWQRRFGADSKILGRTVRLDGDSYTIVGVLPASFQPPTPSDVYIPAILDSQEEMRGNHSSFAIGRLKPGVSVEQAQAELVSIAHSLSQEYKGSNDGVSAKAVPMQADFTGEIRPALLILLGAVGCVLLIACANVANLLLARGSARRKEIAVRVALGAARGRLVRQMLTESTLLAFAGGVAGFFIALWSVGALRLFALDELPSVRQIRVDIPVLLFTLAISLLTGFVFGIAPALRFSRVNLHDSLKEGSGRSSSGLSRNRLRQFLVAAEVAIALVLLTGAGLLVKSFSRITHIDPGFRPDRVLTMAMIIPQAKYTDQAKYAAFIDRVLQKTRALPGVESAAATSKLPLKGGSNGTLAIEGWAKRSTWYESPLVEFSRISPDYFRSLRVPLIKGRYFSAHDKQGSLPVAIVNETMARKFWPNQNPIGKRVSHSDNPPHWLQVVGVVGDVAQHGMFGTLMPEMYTPLAQDTSPWLNLVVHTSGDPLSLGAAVANQVRETDADQAVYNIKSMDQIIGELISWRRFVMLLLGIFSGVALALSAIGIYGVISYSVSQRTREIGIRMALGAGEASVLKMIAGQGMIPVLSGVIVGVLGALGLTQLLASLLYGVKPTDLETFASVALLLLLIAALACYMPARRAARVDPLTALRYE